MADLILKNLYHNNKKVPMMFNNGEFLYRCVTRLVFSVDVDDLSFDPSGETKTFNITSNDDWSMTIPFWLTASALSGTGNATITLTADATEENKDGEVIITCQGKTHSIEVKQVNDYSKEYFTIEALEDGIFVARNGSLSYSINGGEWTGAAPVSNIPLLNGDVVRFKGNSASYNGVFSGNTIQFKVYGNVESLMYGDNFINKISSGPLLNIFNGCSGLKDASNLILPATALISNCYYYMFYGCVSLTTPPELPATTLAEACYAYMFRNCSSLTTAPELPATRLATYCYSNMFRGCTSLTTAPELPATTLAESCYHDMFRGCTKINHIKCLAANKSAANCTVNWLSGVSPTGTFVKAAGVTWESGASGIPSGWTVIEE